MSDDKNKESGDTAVDDWGDALAEQAEESGGADADWGDALAEQAESEESADAGWGDALEEQASASDAVEVANPNDDLSRAEFQNLNTSASAGANPDDINLDILLDVPVTISMEIGRTKINIRNLLHLNQGSVIELDRLAGEPMDVLVNGTLIAHGEVVVVNDKFGIRLTDVIGPAERVKKLR
jgi:flagellar motor switch protein FliN/FliY